MTREAFKTEPFKNRAFRDLSLREAEILFEAAQTRIVAQNRTYSYVLVMKEGRTYSVHQVSNQPCWGDLREYKGDNAKQRPSDLIYPFPEGRPVALAVRQSPTATYANLLEKDSAYRNLTYEHKGSICSFYDLDVDSNYLINFLFALTHQYSQITAGCYHFANAVVSSLSIPHGSNRRLVSKGSRCKWIRGTFDLDALARAKPGSPVGLFSERAPYDRFTGGVEGIWNGEDSLFELAGKDPNELGDLTQYQSIELVKTLHKELEKRRA